MPFTTDPSRWARLLAIALACLGCTAHGPSTPDPADPGDADRLSDGQPVPDADADAAPDADAPADARAADAAPPAAIDAEPVEPEPEPESTHFVDHGRCFEHTPRCGADADCDAALYRGCDGGRCRLDAPCGCADDADCADGDLCVTNERVCGACVPAPARCPDGACAGGDVCVDGWCRQACPGHDDGPPLDCRGEPRPGRCDGRWAYLREAGTCVPVDAVGCVDGGNAFGSRAACVARCRGPIACTATLERVVGNTEQRVVECPISHGPGACVALAHCLCELEDAVDPVGAREQRRACAFSWSVPRGAITLADFCGRDTVSEVIARMRGEGGLDAVFGPETRLELSPGCAEVVTDMSIGPMCMDGAQNGWETGVDCGVTGCAQCPE